MQGQIIRTKHSFLMAFELCLCILGSEQALIILDWAINIR
jgi:hypothetical protein